MRMLYSAVRSAYKDGQAAFKMHGIQHRIVQQDGAADIELGPQTVVWRFNEAKLVEILYLMQPLVDKAGAGHQYIDDLHSPVETLILSVDEYVGIAPYGEFPELSPAPPSMESSEPTD
jgi:hypothetical protein